jgi:hypothetical protein
MATARAGTQQPRGRGGDAANGSWKGFDHGHSNVAGVQRGGVRGRTATTNLTTPWRIAITVMIGSGLALVIVGLWHALAAEVGSRARLQSLEQIRAHHGSVQAYQVSLAAVAAGRLQDARRLVAIALALLLAGVLLTWWAPAAPADGPPAYLKVTHGDSTTCGALASADHGNIRLTVTGAHDPLLIPMDSVTSMTVAAACR